MPENPLFGSQASGSAIEVPLGPLETDHSAHLDLSGPLGTEPASTHQHVRDMSQVFGDILGGPGSSDPPSGLPPNGNPFAAAQDYSSSSRPGQPSSQGVAKASADAKSQGGLAFDDPQNDTVTHEIVPENEEKKRRLLKAGASLKASLVGSHRARASTALLDKLRTQ